MKIDDLIILQEVVSTLYFEPNQTKSKSNFLLFSPRNNNNRKKLKSRNFALFYFYDSSFSGFCCLARVPLVVQQFDTNKQINKKIYYFPSFEYFFPVKKSSSLFSLTFLQISWGIFLSMSAKFKQTKLIQSLLIFRINFMNVLLKTLKTHNNKISLFNERLWETKFILIVNNFKILQLSLISSSKKSS